jgi:hypothetical protein
MNPLGLALGDQRAQLRVRILSGMHVHGNVSFCVDFIHQRVMAELVPAISLGARYGRALPAEIAGTSPAMTTKK